jgi:hypothetical protein
MRPVRWLFHGASFVVTALVVASGCSSGSGDLRDGSYGADNFYDLNALDPSSGDTCTHDAVVACGFERLGTKVCTCASGVYTQCPCFPPRDWQGALTAPPCDALTATASALRGQSCIRMVGSQCIDRSVADPALQEGCKCIETGGTPQWACGSPSQLQIPSDAVSCLTFATGDENYLKNKPCANPWQECIARNFVDGTTPHGCVCLNVTGTMRWACGSTNKWFVPE